jgi:hypothetical protein
MAHRRSNRHVGLYSMLPGEACGRSRKCTPPRVRKQVVTRAATLRHARSTQTKGSPSARANAGMKFARPPACESRSYDGSMTTTTAGKTTPRQASQHCTTRASSVHRRSEPKQLEVARGPGDSLAPGAHQRTAQRCGRERRCQSRHNTTDHLNLQQQQRPARRC